MAAPTHDNAQLTILQAEIDAAGDARTKATTDKALGAILPAIWDMYADKAALGPRLRYLYAKKHAIDFWMVAVFRDVDTTETIVELLHQQSLHLRTIREGIVEDIAAMEKDLASARGTAVATAELTTQSALPAISSWTSDPNHAIYRGDARYPRRRSGF